MTTTAFDKARRGMLHAIIVMMHKFDISPIEVTDAWMDRDDAVNHAATSSLIRHRPHANVSGQGETYV